MTNSLSQFTSPLQIYNVLRTLLLVACTIAYTSCLHKRGTSITGLMRHLATLPQNNRQLLVVKVKLGRPPGELGVSKSMKCDTFPLSTPSLLVGQQQR